MKPSASAVRVVIGGMTMRFLISTGPMRAGVSKMFMTISFHGCGAPPCYASRDAAFGKRPGGASASQRRNLAAVEIDGGAVHPGGARRHQESDQVGDVLNGAEPGDAEAAAHFLARLVLRPAGALHLGLDATPQPIGLDHAGMDAVDLHALVPAAVGETFGESGDGGIDRGSDGELRGRLAAAGAADG